MVYKRTLGKNKEEMLELYAKGWSMQQIAKKFEVKMASLVYRFNQWGIKERRKNYLLGFPARKL